MKLIYNSLFLSIFLIISSCSVQKRAIYSSPTLEQPQRERAEINVDQSTNQAATPLQELKEAAKDRKIVYDATLKIEVDSLTNESTEVLKIVNGYGGYILYSRKDYAKIRIPSKELESALTDIKSLGTVIDEAITGKDITDQYFDIKTRLENAEKTRNRYLALLEKANTIPEILQLEKELERLNNQIESYKGQIKRLDELEAYTTITVYFQPKVKTAIAQETTVKPGPIGYVFVGLYKGIKWLFVRKKKV